MLIKTPRWFSKFPNSMVMSSMVNRAISVALGVVRKPAYMEGVRPKLTTVITVLPIMGGTTTLTYPELVQRMSMLIRVSRTLAITTLKSVIVTFPPVAEIVATGVTKLKDEFKQSGSMPSPTSRNSVADTVAKNRAADGLKFARTGIRKAVLNTVTMRRVLTLVACI